MRGPAAIAAEGGDGMSILSLGLLAEPDEAVTASHLCACGRQFAELAPESRMTGDCEGIASTLYRRMCLHEHARDAYVCGTCTVKLNARGICLDCLELDGDIRHSCPITLIRLTGGAS